MSGGVKQSIMETIIAHPDWCGAEIAACLGCNPATVRSVVNRAGIALPSKVSRKPRDVIRTGRIPYAGRE